MERGQAMLIRPIFAGALSAMIVCGLIWTHAGETADTGAARVVALAIIAGDRQPIIERQAAYAAATPPGPGLVCASLFDLSFAKVGVDCTRGTAAETRTIAFRPN